MAHASSQPLEKMIGQMIMVGFEGEKPTDPQVRDIIEKAGEGKIGGVIFFGYNLKSPDQVRKLTQAIRCSSTDIPLFLAIDQEGGKVQRLKGANGFQDTASPWDVARQMTPAEARKYYEEAAKQVSWAGFNVVLGPVVDLHCEQGMNPCPVIGALGRSFSSDPQVVAEYAAAFVDAHHKLGIITAPKHFPGHGFASGDSHKGMVDITETCNPEKELEPFRILVDNSKADMIMTAHLVNRKLDLDYPATLSGRVIEDLLRKELGYEGVVISDDMHMGAIASQYSREEAVIQAIKAGCDILVFSNNKAAAQGVQDFRPSTDIVNEVHAIIIKALKEGKLTEKNIRDSFDRICSLKERKGRD